MENLFLLFPLFSQFRRQSKPLINWLRHPLKVMFSYNASLKLSPNRWTLGIAMKVLFSITQPAMMGWKFPSRPLVFLVFNLLKWLELFSFLSLIFRIFSRNTRHQPQPSTNSISRQFIPPLRSICHELFTTNQPPQTQSCIMEKNILLPSQCLIHLHGKWI